ncbi:hypothetical protein [Sphingomonas sp. 3-13AW]|uniref:hypothetical protein n=1 Tax=Sphingomonas sp. 3-13AW TaxID=3050450 RepID=UPI003BB680DC
MTIRWSGRLLLAIMLLPASGCSKPSEASGQDAQAAEHASLTFDGAFAEARRANEEAAAARDRSYEYVPSVRRAMGRQMAENVRETFTLSTAITDRDAFLQSGAAAEVADRKLEALDLPLNDLASASVLLFGVAWELANAQPLNAAQQRALVRLVDAELKDSSDPGPRRREAEAQLAIAGFWLEEQRLRQGSADQMRALSDAVQRDMHKLSGNDMRAHDLTDKGFVER